MIHQYRLNGYNIVLDVNSGSVHCVDDASYDIIRLFCGIIEGEGREVTEEDRAQITDQILRDYPEESPESGASRVFDRS